MKNCIPFFALVKKSSIFHCFHELYPLTNFQHQPSNNYREKSPGNPSYPLCVCFKINDHKATLRQKYKAKVTISIFQMTKTFSYNLAQKKMEQKTPLPSPHSSIKDEAIQRPKQFSHPWFGGERGLNFLSVIFVHDCTYELLIWGRSEVRTFPQEWPQPSLRHLLGPTTEVYKRYFFVHHCTEALFL